LKISESESNCTAQNIDEAVKVLKKGGVISFPTETYYGLGVDPFDNTAVDQLFLLKKRERNKPILVLVSDIDMLSLLVANIPEQYGNLMKKFWPGPLTLIFPAKETVSPLLTGATGSIGIRISSNRIVKEIFKKWRKPFTATSANISNQAPAKSSAEVLSYFGEKIDCLIDGGETPAGLCSSIVAFRNERFIEIRKGQIPFSELTAQVNK
jgi:L-threonylcarbamoyladenylate synthase